MHTNPASAPGMVGLCKSPVADAVRPFNGLGSSGGPSGSSGRLPFSSSAGPRPFLPYQKRHRGCPQLKTQGEPGKVL